MEQSQLREEVARLNEELDRVKAELKVEREKLTNQQQPDDGTPSKIKIDNISGLPNTIRLFFS